MSHDEDRYLNQCATNAYRWTTTAVTPVTGWINIFDAPDAPDGFRIDPCPALLLQESAMKWDEGEWDRITRVVYATADSDSGPGELEVAKDLGGYLLTVMIPTPVGSDEHEAYESWYESLCRKVERIER